MLRFYVLSAVIFIVMMTGTPSPGFGQLLLNENFDYAAGSQLISNGWAQTGTSATSPVLVSAAGLTYTGYPSSGIGNAADLGTTGQDVNKNFTQQNTGTVYTGFLVNVASAQTAGDYFFHLIEGPVTGNIFKGRVWIKKDASGSGIAFGLSKSSTAAASIAYTGFSYSIGTTYLLVLKYQFSSGTTTDDNVTLYVEPLPGAPEPAIPTLTYLDNTQTDALNIEFVALRQGSSSNAAALRVDGIRVGLTWQDVVGTASITPPTVQASNISFSNVTAGTMTTSWTNGDGAKRVVIINTANSFTNPVNGTDPTANAAYGGSGEQVIYNGNGNSVNVTGLSPNTVYWYRVYEYNGSGATTQFLTVTATLNPNSQATPVLLTAPVITGPAVSSISSGSAVLGGNITSSGGSPVTERGTVWSTSTGVSISDNKLAEGGTATGVFSHTRTGLPAQTKIYFKAYATNIIGTTLTTEASFFTLSPEPTTHVTGFSATATGNTSINLTWSTQSAGASGYLVLMKQGVSAPTGIPADGTGYTEGNTIGDATVAAIVTPASVLAKSIIGLSPGTTYAFTLVPFEWNGTDAETYNYLTSPVIPSSSATTTGSASVIYTWTGADNGSWVTPGNWSPARTTPASTDILQFTDGTTKTVTGVITQSIARLVMANATTINLQSSSACTLTITGAAGADLEVPAGCALNLNAINAITISLSPTATGAIAGNVKFSATASTAHRLIAADAGAIEFQNNAVFTAGTFFSGNPFGTASLNSVVFAAGSTYLQQAGSNPFGAGQPNSVVVFQPGSLFKATANLTPSFSGRSYANFELDAPGVTLSPSGSVAVSIDSLKITNGTLNFNMTGPTTGAHMIKGNVSVTPLSFLNFNPASAGTVTFGGGGVQKFTIAGTLSMNTNATLEISNGTQVQLNTPLTITGQLKLTNGYIVTGNHDFTLTNTATLTINPSATAMIVATGSGQYIRQFPAGFSGPVVFPVGDLTDVTEYSPATITFPAGTFSATGKVGVNLVNGKYPTDPNNVNYLKRYWNITAQGITGNQCNVVCQYLPADINGNENELFAMQVDPQPFASFGLANSALHQLEFNGIPSFGTFTGSQPRPLIQTNAASAIGANTATLHGEAIANYLPTTVSFEYGPTTTYGSTIAATPATVNGGGTNTFLANVSGLTQNTTYHYRAVGTNLQGTSYGADLTFTTTCPAPAAGGTISGPSTVCPNGTGYIYTTTPVANATSYNWTLPAGFAITAGAGTTSITVSCSASPASGNITVNGVSVCGSGAPSGGFNVGVNPLPVPVITGPATACINSPGNVYSTETGMSGYTWTISGGGTITSGMNTNTITVTWNSAGPQSVSVTYASSAGCQAAAPTVYNVNVTQLPVPTISGPNVVCANAAGIVYTTEPGMTNYNWAVSIGGTIVSGAGTNAITVLWPYPGQRTVNVTYSTPTGCAANVPTVFNVTINPAAVPTIGSSGEPCINSVNNQYITASGMTGYNWSISQGGTIVSGLGTNQINVTWNQSGPQWVSVGYTNSYGCTSVTPTVYNLFVNPLPYAAGPITGEDELCAGTTGVSYSCAPVINATSYVWDLPAGATIASGAGTNSIVVNYGSSANSGNITVAGHNSCGNGTPSPVLPVTVHPIPAAPVVTANGSYLTSSAYSGNQWYYEGSPIAGATGSTYTAIKSGYYWSVVTVNGCSSAISNKVYVVITSVPEAESNSVRIFPVPSKGEFSIRFGERISGKIDVTLVDEIGKIVFHQSDLQVDQSGDIVVDPGNPADGIYFVKIKSEKEEVVRKVVIRK